MWQMFAKVPEDSRGNPSLQTLKRLKPGEALSEKEVALRYGVSRQPVREAFIKLAEERLVSIQPQRGTFVVKISMKEVLDARFVREAIEVAVALEAASITPLGLIKELRTLVAQQSALPPRGPANRRLAHSMSAAMPRKR